MPTLLSLPLELLTSILALAISTSQKLPPNPPPDDCDRIPLLDYPSRAWGDAREHILYPRSWSPLSTAHALLLTSSQLHALTKEILVYRPHEKLRYEVDIMFSRPYLMPTWLSVPKLSQRTDELYVQWRCFSTPFDSAISEPTYNYVWSGGDGSLPALVWYLYALLERFLHLGAAGPQAKFTAKKKTYVVQTLVLDFISPDEGEHVMPPTYKFKEWLRVHRSPARFKDSPEKRALFEKVMRPEWFAKWVVAHVEGLLDMNNYTAGYGGVLYECFGSIRVCVDGVVWHEWELAGILEGLGCQSNPYMKAPRRERREEFEEWKEEALRMRAERGLPVVWPRYAEEDIRFLFSDDA